MPKPHNLPSTISLLFLKISKGFVETNQILEEWAITSITLCTADYHGDD